MPLDRRVEAVVTLIRLGWSPPPPNREQTLRMLDDMTRTRGRPTNDLAPSELRLLGLLANGETTASAARRTRTSPHTTKAQAKKIREKLGVATITRAVALAVDEGWVEVRPR
jgi:DNA-binding NarL/FixJ family response regulator